MSDANTAYTVQTNCEQSLVYESGAFYGNAGSTRPIDFIGGGYTSGQALRNSSCGDEEVNCLNPWDYQTKRIFDPNGKYCTLQANNGGCGRLDGVCYPINTMVATRGGKDDMRTTFGIGDANDPQFTISAAHEHGVCYAIDSQSSNSWKSDNPNSGIHKENVSKTLDTRPDPSCNQGGNVIVQSAAFMGGQGAKARSIAYCDDGTTPTIKASPSGGNTVPDTVYCLQGNGIDRSETAGCNGAGWRENESYTLNTIDRPAVCFQQNQREEVRDMGGQAGALTAEAGVHNQNYVCYPDKARSLCARYDSSPCVDRGQNVVCYAPEGNHCGMYRKDDTSATLQTKYHYGSGGDAATVVYDCRGNGDGKTIPTLTGDHNNRVTDFSSVVVKEYDE